MHAFLITIISFVFVLGVLVFIHELGHYLAARWRGVHVDVFSIGFGKPLYCWHDKVGTEWRICPIPLGGFVKPHGFENPEDATEEQKLHWISGKTFYDKPVLDRSIVILAGPLFNFILAVFLFTGLFIFSGKPYIKPIVNDVLPNSAASLAGIQSKDIIIQLGNLKNPDAQNLIIFAQQHPGLSTSIVVARAGKEVTLPITIFPKNKNNKIIGQLGISIGLTTTEKHKLSIVKAFKEGIYATWYTTKNITIGLGQLVTGQHSIKEMGGFIGIAQASGQYAEHGFDYLIEFMALLSVNLGLVNLLPIPMLDGGRLLFYLIEAVCRRPVHKSIQIWAFQIGFGLILMLFLITAYNDISRLGLLNWFTSHSR